MYDVSNKGIYFSTEYFQDILVICCNTTYYNIWGTGVPKWSHAADGSDVLKCALIPYNVQKRVK